MMDECDSCFTNMVPLFEVAGRTWKAQKEYIYVDVYNAFKHEYRVTFATATRCLTD
jgi:hypothetical protein